MTEKRSEPLKVNWNLAPGYVRPDPVVDQPPAPGFPDRDGYVYWGMARIRGRLQIDETVRGRSKRLRYGNRQRILLQRHIGTGQFYFKRWNRPGDQWRYINEDCIRHPDIDPPVPPQPKASIRE